MIISIDFDETIVHSNFPVIISLIPDAKLYITKLHEDGHYIIINTCRTGDDAIAAINFLLANDIPFRRFNENNISNVEKYKSNSRKIYAHVYIDDRQVGGLPPWSEIYEYVNKIEKQYREKTEIPRSVGE